MKDKIVLDNLGLIYKVLKNMNYVAKDEEDFEEAYYCGLVGLIKASKTYDEAKSKSSYLYQCIKSEISNLYKRRTRKKYIQPFMISLQDSTLTDILYENILASDEDIEKNYRLKETINEMLDLLNKYPNQKHREIIKLNFGIQCEKESLREISNRYGVTYQAIGDIRKRVLNKLNRELSKCI